MLKRHLNSAHNLAAEGYCRKWDLPPDYPMVAATYPRRRSAAAKSAAVRRETRQEELTRFVPRRRLGRQGKRAERFPFSESLVISCL